MTPKLLEQSNIFKQHKKHLHKYMIGILVPNHTPSLVQLMISDNMISLNNFLLRLPNNLICLKYSYFIYRNVFYSKEIIELVQYVFKSKKIE